MWESKEEAPSKRENLLVSGEYSIWKKVKKEKGAKEKGNGFQKDGILLSG